MKIGHKTSYKMRCDWSSDEKKATWRKRIEVQLVHIVVDNPIFISSRKTGGVIDKCLILTFDFETIFSLEFHLTLIQRRFQLVVRALNICWNEILSPIRWAVVLKMLYGQIRCLVTVENHNPVLLALERKINYFSVFVHY